MELQQACPNVDFRPLTAMNTADARKLLESDGEVDGYLVYMVGLWTGAGRTLAASGCPVLFVDDLYAGSGEYLIALSEAKRKGYKVAGVASTRFDDVVQAGPVPNSGRKRLGAVGAARGPGVTVWRFPLRQRSWAGLHARPPCPVGPPRPPVRKKPASFNQNLAVVPK